MLRSSYSLVIVLLALMSCGDRPDELTSDQAPVTMQEWEGEYRIVDGEPRFLTCINGTYHAVGGPMLPQLDSIFKSSVQLPGSAMKAWVKGHFTKQGQDSTLIIAEVLHTNSALRCPLFPYAIFSGRYANSMVMNFDRKRDVLIDLFPDGSSMMYTDLNDGRGMIEEDGTWGATSDSAVQVTWPMHSATMLFEYTGSELVAAPKIEGGPTLIFSKTGDPVREFGWIVRVKEFIRTTSLVYKADSANIELDRSTSIALLYPTDEARKMLHQAIEDRYGINKTKLDEGVIYLENVGDVVALLRRTGH